MSCSLNCTILNFVGLGGGVRISLFSNFFQPTANILAVKPTPCICLSPPSSSLSSPALYCNPTGLYRSLWFQVPLPQQVTCWNSQDSLSFSPNNFLKIHLTSQSKPPPLPLPLPPFLPSLLLPPSPFPFSSQKRNLVSFIHSCGLCCQTVGPQSLPLLLILGC